VLVARRTVTSPEYASGSSSARETSTVGTPARRKGGMVSERRVTLPEASSSSLNRAVALTMRMGWLTWSMRSGTKRASWPDAAASRCRPSRRTLQWASSLSSSCSSSAPLKLGDGV
jgi:hypothetical protein